MKLFGKKLKINFNKFVTIIFLLWITLIYEGRHIPGSLWLAENTPLIIKLFVYLVMAFCMVLFVINYNSKKEWMYDLILFVFFFSSILFVILFQNQFNLFVILILSAGIIFNILYDINNKSEFKLFGLIGKKRKKKRKNKK